MTIQERAELSMMWWASMPIFEGWMSYRPKSEEDNPGVWESCVPSALRPRTESEYPLFAASVVESALEGVDPATRLAIRSNLKACLSDPNKPLIHVDERLSDLRARVIREVYRQQTEWINF